jgi:hypothetical protein
MKTIERLATRRQWSGASDRSPRCLSPLVAVLLGLTFATGAPRAAESGKDGDYVPSPPAQRTLAPSEEVAFRLHMAQQEDREAALAGLASAEREHDQMRALGLNPADPVALSAYRAEMQSSPASVMAAGDFILNPAWGSGGLSADRYAGANEGEYLGKKAAMLSNGEVVVVGRVKFNSGSSRQLGMTKRKADGSRAVWTGAAAQYSQYGGQYIIYPNTNTSVPPVWDVVDVKVRNDRIYVLVTGQLSSPSTYSPNILCFNADGSTCGWWFAYMTASNPTNDAVAMDIYADHLVVLGRNSLSRTGGFWTVMFPFNADGSLGTSSGANFPAPGGYDRSEPADIAFRRSTLFVLGAPRTTTCCSRKNSRPTPAITTTTPACLPCAAATTRPTPRSAAAARDASPSTRIKATRPTRRSP